MEFLAESIGLLDMDGGSSSGFGTPKNKPAHANASNDTSFSSMIGVDSERRQSQGSALQSPAECDRCSKKTFNLALENLKDMESCCRCDCQRGYYNNSGGLDDCYDSEFDLDDGDCDRKINISKAVQTGDISCNYEEDSVANESKPQSTPMPNRISANRDNSQLTRLVTQRIDARTNYNCFTGKVDALTGEIIHGLLVYRVTGEVYEGPFVSVPRQNNQNLSFSNDYSMLDSKSIDNSAKKFATVSLRHGSNATSHHPNGMTFTGSYEYDVPKFGKWIMKDNDGNEEWMYEGPLIEVRTNNNDSSEPSISGGLAALSPRGRSPSVNSVSISSPPSSGNLSAASLSTNRVIGVSTPLPGSVLFHGNGTFTRYSDGMRYKGEFDFGLAHGVGKEIVPNLGDVGESVYQGEFANGVRHGVGTLIEDVIINDDQSGCNERDEHREECNRMLFAVDEELNTDNGPDFAAGCSNTHEEIYPIPGEYNAQDNDIRSTPCSRSMRESTYLQPMTRKQMKSGVWCAGQFEVQDVVGVVHHTSDGNKEFVEDTSPSIMPAGTTWDLLPEKWLGLG